MGGRGISSGANTAQMSIAEYAYKEKISAIIQTAKEKLSGMQGGSAGGGEAVGAGSEIASPLAYKRCACCKSYSIIYGSNNQVCCVCGWVDDEYQNLHPDSAIGGNDKSLNDYRQEYLNNSNK